MYPNPKQGVDLRGQASPSKEVINAAVKQAQLSVYRFRVGAVVFVGSNILGRGVNDAIKTHPKSPHPFHSRHAEFNAILDTAAIFGQRWNKPLTVVSKGVSIYVHRLKADGSPGLARPCRWCQGMLDQLGITKIYWSEG